MEEHKLDPAVESLRATIRSLREEDPVRSDGLQAKLEQLVGMMPRFPDHFIYVYNYSEGRIVYHRGFDEVLGYTDGEVGIELLYRIFHPDDAPIVARLNEATIRTMATIRDPGSLFDLTLSVDYRMQRRNGSYVKVFRQTCVFEVDKQTGRVISTCSLCKDISTIKSSTDIGWQVRGMDSARVDMSALAAYTTRMQYRPSPREMDVVRELAKGRTSKEVAHALGISLHTVNAHRRNLLERTGLSNTAELVRRVSELGWL